LQEKERSEKVITLYRMLNGEPEASTVSQARAARMLRAGWSRTPPEAKAEAPEPDEPPKKRGRPRKGSEK